MARGRTFSTSEVRALTGAGPGQLQRWIREGSIPGMEQRQKGDAQPRRQFSAKQVEIVRRLVKEREKVHERASQRRSGRNARAPEAAGRSRGAAPVREVRTAASDTEANELLRQGWELHSVATTGLAVQFVLVRRRGRGISET
jgi:hypothetical protein